MTTEATFENAPDFAQARTVSEAWSSLVRNPSQFIRHWNYKGAILSGLLRAPIFLITYLVAKEGLKLAIAAAVVQFTYRFAFAGITGAIIQSFRRVEPAWKALATILLAVPVVSHLFEFGFQTAFASITGTADHTDQAIVRSICVSIISALFTLFIMRRNVMIVGEEGSKSLFRDVVSMPFLIFDFIAFIPNEIASFFRRGAYLSVVLAIAGFGVFSQMLVWAVMNKAFWTYGGGRSIAFLKFWGVDGMILLIIATILSIMVPTRGRIHVTKT